MVDQTYHPKIGDVVEVGAHRVHEPARVGEIMEVLGEPDHSHFLVKWDDGRETIYYPSNDAIVRSPRRTRREGK